MKHNRAAARTLALVLALTLAFSLIALPAWAEDSRTVFGEVGAKIISGPSVYVWENSTGEYSVGNKVYLNQGDSYPDNGNPLVTYEPDNPVTVTVNANIDSQWSGINAFAKIGTVIVNAADGITITAAVNGIDAAGSGGTVTVNAPGVNVTAGGFGVNAVSETNGSATVTAGNVTSTGSIGIRVQGGMADTPGTTTVTAKTVTAAGKGVSASSYYGGSTTIKVGTTDENGTFTGGTVTSGGKGIVAEAKNNGRVEVKTGLITLTGENNKTAVEASISTGGSVDITAGDPASNGVSVQGSGGQGIIIRNSSGYETTVNADSIGTEANPVTGTGVDVASTGAGSATTVNIGTTDESGTFTGGTILAGGKGIHATSQNGGQTTVRAGSVGTAEKPITGTGVDVTSTGAGSVTTVTVDSVSASGANRFGVYTRGSGTTATVSGSVNVSGKGSIGVIAYEGGTVNAGTVTVTGDYSIGVNAFRGGTVNAGSITATGDKGEGVWVWGPDGSTVNVKESIKAGNGIDIDLYPDAKHAVTVAGDVIAADKGIYVSHNTNVTPGQDSVPGRAEVLIGGTLSGQNPVVLGEGADDGLLLTVWKVQRNGADGKEKPYGTDEYIVSKNFDPTIRYIIRMQQPKEHAKLTVTDKDGNDLEKLPEVKDADGNTVAIDGIGTAKEEEVILVIAEVDEGYKVTVYGSDGTAKPLTTEDGKTWSMKVPKGGGVFIWADVEKKNTFNIAFYSDEEGKELLQSGTVYEGDIPVYNGKTPTREPTAQYTFTWDGGWEPAIVPATEEAVYKATFKSVTNSYDIHFVSDDGSELEKQHAAYGTTPEYSKGTPEKSPDAQYTYSFSKWDHDIAPVKGEDTYKAVFTGTLRKYDVTFNPDGGTLVAPDGASEGGNYDYGTVITLPDATREDGAPFQGWSDGQNQYKAGDKISVERALALTAMWGDPPEPDPEPDPPKPDPPKPEPEPEPDPEPDPDPDPEPDPEPEPDPDPDPNPPFVGGEEPPASPPPKVGSGMNAYDLFIQRIIEEIRNADENGTVTIDVRDTGWESLKRDIFEAAAERKDVTIIILYTHWTDDYSLTIPAGTNLSPVITTALYLETYKIGPALDITPEPCTD